MSKVKQFLGKDHDMGVKIIVMNKPPIKISRYLAILQLNPEIPTPFFISSQKNQKCDLLHKKISGVYILIGNFESDFVEYPIYIGGSYAAPDRIKNHFINLVRDKHRNQALQRSFNKEGGKFYAFLLETCDKSQVMEREQFYLDSIRPFLSEGRGYNMEKKAKRLDFPHRGALKEESKKKIATANSRPFEIIDPFGNLVQGKNLTEYCRANGLNPPLLCAVINGRRLHHKGYTSVKNKKATKKIGKFGLNLMYRHFSIRSPKGEIIRGINCKKFCEENNLCYTHILAMVSHKSYARKQYKGWTAV